MVQRVGPVEETPHLEFRGVKFNPPWDTYRRCSAPDQHFETVRDLRFWEAFLDVMVENWFNVISLWKLHPYTDMIRAEHFPKRAVVGRGIAEW